MNEPSVIPDGVVLWAVVFFVACIAGSAGFVIYSIVRDIRAARHKAKPVSSFTGKPFAVVEHYQFEGDVALGVWSEQMRHGTSTGWQT